MNVLQRLLQWGEGGPDHTYQNIMQCYDGDLFWVKVSTIANLMVSIAGLIFCIQMFRASRLMHTKQQKATIYALASFFGLWSLGGYWWEAVRYYFPVYRIHTLLILLVAACSWVLVFAEWYTSAIRRYFQKMERAIAQDAKLIGQIEEYRMAIATKSAENDPPKS